MHVLRRVLGFPPAFQKVHGRFMERSKFPLGVIARAGDVGPRVPPRLAGNRFGGVPRLLPEDGCWRLLVLENGCTTD